MKTADVIREIQRLSGSQDLLIFANGRIATEALYIGDAPNHFYMLGSMGQASMIGAGLALACLPMRCVIVDGDGNLLMNPAAVITIGKLKLSNLVHIVIDNGKYQTTGGQSTVGDVWDMASFASDCGYRSVHDVNTLEGFSECFGRLSLQDGPVFIRVRVVPGILEDAPTFDKGPGRISEDFSKYLKGVGK